MTEGRGLPSKASIRRRAATGTPILVALLIAVVVPASAQVVEARERSAGRSYIVTLDVPDAGRAIDPSGRAGRERVRTRAQRTRSTTDRLERDYGFRAAQRYAFALSGFAARLTRRQVARLARDGAVAAVRPVRRYRIASQSVPVGVRRVGAIPAGGPDIDADIAVLDTGIGPVGGDELNVQGGINCSDDGRGPSAWRDLHDSSHGTHVAGIAAARDNGLGVVGVAPGARLWSVRVFQSDGYGDEATIVCGLDWVLATHGPTPPADSRPIEVVNMSLEGSRAAADPEGCQGRPTPDPDPMHLAVCAVHAAGVTIVAAAGNDAIDARFVSPAGYDQVVTVGAISEFDGRPRGRSASLCGTFVLGAEGDDRYARYSNRGSDVDIVAPGTCVVSTLPSASGDATQRLTGTSMAAPHVSGAVARYLAAHPGTDPERMRRLLRAAGGLDWLIASDPDWDGPNDSSPPRRLLDVAALLGPPGLRAWVLPRSLVADADTSRRRARVDIQRLGGFDGPLTLQLDDLPGPVGSATFSPTTLGLGDLGSGLTIQVRPDAPEGRHVTLLDAPDAPTIAGRRIPLRVDRSGPVIDGMRVAIRRGEAAIPRGRSAPVRVAWSVEDALGTVGRTTLRKRVGGGSWRDVATGKGLSKAVTSLRAGIRTSFRVTSRDDLGNMARSKAHAVLLTIRDSSSSRWVSPASGWQTSSSDSAIGRSILTTRSRRSSLSIDVEGDAFAIVAPVGPRRGSFRVRIDEGPWRVVDLRSRTARARRVVHRAALSGGTHRLEVRAATGEAAIDALLLIR